MHSTEAIGMVHERDSQVVPPIGQEKLWRDMDTAPEDGTVVILSTADSIFIGYLEQKWNWKRLRTDRNWQCLWWRDEIEPKTTITGWMPLPKPTGVTMTAPQENPTSNPS